MLNHPVPHTLRLAPRELEPLKDLRCELRADLLVIVEGVLVRSAFSWTRAARLCDVVQERGEADDEVGGSEVQAAQRVPPDVPAVVAVLREVHGLEQLGNDACEQPGTKQEAQAAARRSAPHQQLDQ